MTVSQLKIEGPSELNFSYSHITAYDDTTEASGVAWTPVHVDQGFARLETAVSFSTILEFGKASVRVFEGSLQSPINYNRIISVPLKLVSGEMRVDGPEEFWVERRIILKDGIYLVTLAQKVTGERSEAMDIFLEASDEWPGRSRIVLADDRLKPPTVLVETAQVAQI